MMIYECLMLMLMLCKSSYARLTPEVLQDAPIKRLGNSRRDRTLETNRSDAGLLCLIKYRKVP